MTIIKENLIDIFKRKFNISTFFEYINLVLASIIVFAPLLYREVIIPIETVDYPDHIHWAKNIFMNPQLVPPYVIAHSAWQWLVLCGHLFFSLSWGISGLVITLASVIATSMVIYWYLRKHLNPLLAGALSIGLLIVAPLFFIEPLGKNPYFADGYIATNVYHNPTILLLKPLVIL
jgi:ABC-type sulfate transport system permease component